MARNIWGDRIHEQKRHYDKKKFTTYDRNTGYFKIAMMILAGYLYFHLVLAIFLYWSLKY